MTLRATKHLTRTLAGPLAVLLAATLAVLSLYVSHEMRAGVIQSAKLGMLDAATRMHELRTVDGHPSSGAARASAPLLYSAHPYPDGRARQLDEFQLEAWNRLRQDPDTPVTLREQGSSGDVLRLAVAEKLSEQVCVDCHNGLPGTPKGGWQLDDLAGVLELRANIGAALTAANVAAARVTGIIATVLSIGLALGGFAFWHASERRWRDRLKALREPVSETTATAHTASAAAKELLCTAVAEGSARDQLEQELRRLASERIIPAEHGEPIKSLQEITARASVGRSTIAGQVAALIRLREQAEGLLDNLTALGRRSEGVAAGLERTTSSVEQARLITLNAAIEAGRENGTGRALMSTLDQAGKLSGAAGESLQALSEEIGQLGREAREARAALQAQTEELAGSLESLSEAGESIQRVSQLAGAFESLNEQLCRANEARSAMRARVSEIVSELRVDSSQSAQDIRYTSAQLDRLVLLAGALGNQLDRLEESAAA